MNISGETNQLISTIINVLIIPLIPVVSAFIISYIKKKTAELESGIKNQTLQKYIDIAESAIVSSVSAVNQIYVDSLKKQNGFLSDDQQKTAFNMAKENILKIIGDSGTAALKELYNDLDAWLNTRIEYHVNQQKTTFAGISGDGVNENNH